MKFMKEAKKSKNLGIQQAFLRTQTCFRVAALSCAFLLLLAAVPADAQEPQVSLQLMLSGPASVPAGERFNIRVFTDATVPAGTVVTARVSFGDQARVVTLASFGAFPNFRAPNSLVTDLPVTATATVSMVPEGTSVTVRDAADHLISTRARFAALALFVAPSIVDAEQVLTVTVTAPEGSLEGVTATVRVAFHEDTVDVMLSEGFGGLARFTAPTLETMATLEVTAVSIAVEPVALVLLNPAVPRSVQVRAAGRDLTLSLEGPLSVQVGEDFSVTVGTGDVAVPPGTTVTVRVAVNGGPPMTTTLTDTISTASVSFTAPAEAGDVRVTATGVPQTSMGSLRVQVLDAPELTVSVVEELLQATLTLSEFPSLVSANSTFTVTVGISPVLPPDASVEVQVTFGTASQRVILTEMIATTAVVFMAPDVGGLVELRADSLGTITAVGTDLNVEPTMEIVQVQEQISLKLLLDGFDRRLTVSARDDIPITVRTDAPVPEGVTVTVMINFDGEVRTVMLTSTDDFATEAFTAPARLVPDPGFLVTAEASSVTMANANILVDVEDSDDGRIRVIPRFIRLTLSEPDPRTVDAGESFTVMVGTQIPLVDTTITAEVTFNESTRQVVLSEQASERMVSFIAPALEVVTTLEVTADSVTFEPEDIVIVNDAPPRMVQVLAARRELTLSLDGPLSVQADEDFSVTVGTGDVAVPEGTTVVVTVMVSNGQAMTTTLTATISTASVVFRAPTEAGSEVTVTATGNPLTSIGSLGVQVFNAPALTVSVATEVRQATLTLLEFPSLVSANSTFTVTVGISPALLPGVSVEVEVTFGTASQRMMLTNTTVTVTLELMAPAVGDLVELRADSVGTITAAGTDLNVEPTMEMVQVQEQISLKLVLEGFLTASARDAVTITVRTDVPVPAAATVTVIINFGGEVRPVMLTRTDGVAMESFTARLVPDPGLLVTAEASSVTTANANILVEVENADDGFIRVVRRSIRLTLSEPSSSTVNARESFTVMVDAPPRLLTDTTITAEVTFDESTRQVVLSEQTPERMVSFIAPALAVTTTLDVTAASVAVEPAALVVVGVALPQMVQVLAATLVDLTLSLEGPPGEVQVGEDFSVTVGTTGNIAVPDGTTVTVTVTVNDGAADEQVMTTMLTATTSTASVSFVALAEAGEASVTATGVAETSAGFQELVRVSSATSIAVPVVTAPLQSTLTLSVSTDPVITSEEFEVVVGIIPALPAGVSVGVEVTLDGASPQRMTLRNTDATFTLMFTAPAMAGPVVLRASVVSLTGVAALNNVVESAMATVQVFQEVISLQLELDSRPSDFFLTARSEFDVIVSTDMQVPVGVTVMVTVGFDGEERVVTLTSAVASTEVTFTAPARIVPVSDTSLLTTATATVDRADPGILVVVAPAEEVTRVFLRGILVTISEPTPNPVDAGEAVTVTVSAPQEQLADSTVTMEVTFNEVTIQAVLSGQTPTRMVSFTAPASGTLNVVAELISASPMDLLDPGFLPTLPQSVQVRALSTVQLTLGAPENVTVGEEFTVGVGVSEAMPIPDGAVVNVVATLRDMSSNSVSDTGMGTLTGTPPMASVPLTAPAASGDFVLELSGGEVVTNTLRVTVLGTSATIEVVPPISLQLVLTPPESDPAARDEFNVTVSTDLPVPVGTVVTVTVSFEEQERGVELTNAETSMEVTFTAPARIAENLPVTATATAETAEGETLVVVADAEAVLVETIRRIVPLMLSVLNPMGNALDPMTLEAGDDFTVKVSAVQRLLVDTTIAVTVTFNGDPVQVELSGQVLEHMVDFTAPVLPALLEEPAVRLLPVTAVPGTIEPAELVTVSSATRDVQVREVSPVELTLLLEGPEEDVLAGEDFSVMVGTGGVAVPAGTTVIVTVTVSDGVTDDQAIATMLTAMISTATVSFTAPAEADEVSVTATGDVLTSADSLEIVTLSDATPLTVTVSPLQVQVSLQLELTAVDTDFAAEFGAEFAAAARDEFEIRVSTDMPVPAMTTVMVTVGFEEQERGVELTNAATSAVVRFTAPALIEFRGLPLTATATVERAADAEVFVVVEPAEPARVVIGPRNISLALSEPDPNPVDAGSSFTVTVSASLAGGLTDTTFTVTVMVTFNTVTIPVTLSERELERMVSFTAPGSSGNLDVVAVHDAGTVEPAMELLNILNSGLRSRSVQVRAVSTVQLTLDAPLSVTVGEVFTVDVGVSGATPLPDGTVVNVEAALRDMLSNSVLGTETGTLMDTAPTASVSFAAPAASGDFALDLSGSVEVTDTLRVTVLGASTQIAVVPIPLTLSLEGPEEDVLAGEDFSVMVGTGGVAVPAGTTVLVTVNDGAADEQAMLTARIPTASVSFTAPAEADEVSVTATGVVQTSAGSLEVAVSNATPLTVPVVTGSPLQSTLTLSVASPVNTGSSFNVIVGIMPALPEGVSVEVEVTLDGTAPQRVTLSSSVATVTLEFTAPTMGGAVELRADSLGSIGGTALNVEPATATVQVQVSLLLELTAVDTDFADAIGFDFETFPGIPAEARDDFDIRVRTVSPDEVDIDGNPVLVEVPAGVTVTVTVGFEGEEREAVLTSADTSAVVTFTAPARVVFLGLPLTATATVEKAADADFLVVVAPVAPGLVRILPKVISLVLLEPDPNPVDAGSMFTVTMSASLPGGLTDTTFTVTVEVTYDDETILVTLSERALEGMATFMAPGSGPDTLNVMAALDTITMEPRDLVTVLFPVEASLRSVRVRAVRTVQLTLIDAPLSVTVDDEFAVIVGVSDTMQLLNGAVVDVRATLRDMSSNEVLNTGTGTLTVADPTASVSLTAPAASGNFVLELSGGGLTDTVRVTALGTSTTIAVVVPGVPGPIQLMLSLAGPEDVQVGEVFSVTVGTGDDAVPPGTTVVVTVNDGTTDGQAMLTASTATASVSFTAPIRAGVVSVTATGVVQTSAGLGVLGVSDADPLAVMVLPVQATLTLSVLTDPVIAGESFTIGVSISAGATSEFPVEVAFTLPGGDIPSNVMLLTNDFEVPFSGFVAPRMRGPVELIAGVVLGDGLELSVLPATTTVQVLERVSLTLMLDAPPTVAARDEFDVTVSTDPSVPAGVTVTVTVSFDEMEREAVLTDTAASEVVTFTAPARIVPLGLLVTAEEATAEAADADILVVVGTQIGDLVGVTAQEVQLTLLVPPSPVDANDAFDVRVGVTPALLADTTVAAVVTFNGLTMRTTLTDRDPTSIVSFMAPESGTLDVTAAADAVEPDGLVAVADAATQSVQVRAMDTIELTLGAPASVTVGDSFTVAVGVSDTMPIPAETTVMVTVSFDGAQRMAVLTDAAPTASVSFVAPVTSGGFSLAALSSSVDVLDPLRRVAVTGASTPIEVVPVQLTLSLDGPDVLSAGESFSVTVGTGDDAVPPGTTIMVMVRAGEGTADAVVELTAATPTVPVPLPAPAAGEVGVIATGVVETSAGFLEVALSAASPLTVTVTGLFPVVLRLEVPDTPVFMGEEFSVTVSADRLPQDPAPEVLVVRVSLEFVEEPILVLLTARRLSDTAMFIAPSAVGLTSYTVTTDSDSETGALLITEATTAVVLVTGLTAVNADLSGDGDFNVNDMIIAARGLLTVNHAARVEGIDTSGLGSTREAAAAELQLRLDSFRGGSVADVSGDQLFDLSDVLIITRSLLGEAYSSIVRALGGLVDNIVTEDELQSRIETLRESSR